MDRGSTANKNHKGVIMDRFVHLHAHTSIGSMQDAMTNVDQMFRKASELGQPALAITDHGTMAAVFDARKSSTKYGVKYIPGCEAYFVDDVSLKPDKNDPRTKRRHIVLLAKNEVGYRNLLQLNWKGYQNNQYIGFLNKIFPRIDWQMLEEHHEGIICLTACGSGLVSRQMFVHDDESGEWLKPQCHDNVRSVVSRLKSIFGEDLYLEIQPHNLHIIARNRKDGTPILNEKGEEKVVVDQNHINRMLFNVGNELGVKLVATADVHYLDADDAKIHDMLMAISEKAPLSDKTRHRYEVEEFYMKSSQDIYNHFIQFESKTFAQEVCDNTVEIGEKCVDPAYLDTFEPRFPQFDVEAQDNYGEFLEWHKAQAAKKGVDVPLDHSYMRFQCISAFNRMYPHLRGEDRKEYIDRIKTEIEVLEFHNFSSYMLIVSDYIKKAKERDIPIGPGRGSVCGSLVAHLLDIHDVDSIEYGLLFERFHNKEKTSFPDIDTDIHPDGREWVQQYIVDTYGKEKVAHVSNLSTMTPKVVVKDVARSLELGGSKSAAFKIANQITDSIPMEAKSFDDALEKSKDFREWVAQYPELEHYGKKLVGLEKAYATHAAGVVIGDIPLSTYVPLRIDKDGAVAVQYEKERCEALGLIKMDLLGLEHLKIVDNAIRNARKLGYNPPKPSDLKPYNDEKVWEDISSGKTLCVFQMGSQHMRALCKRIKPRSIEDLSLVNALGRPSAKKSRNTYIARRDGKSEIEYKYECLKPSLGESLGVGVYEEQLAKLANTVAGWDRNKADGLRKLTKLKGKYPELAAKLKKDFITGAQERSGLNKVEAEDIWVEIVEPFEGYGFNKSHGVAYSINGYHSAYYVHYYPAAYMASVLESEAGKGSSPVRDANLAAYKKVAKKLYSLQINPPDINHSDHSYSVLDDKTIVTGLAAIKGVGDRAVEEILRVRDEHPFVSFEDFLLRTSSTLVRKNVIQALAKAGCFDSLNVTRKNAHDQYSTYRTAANNHAKKVAAEGRDAWKILDDFTVPAKVDVEDEWSKKEIGLGEQETLGELLSVDLNDIYDGFFIGRQTAFLNKLRLLTDGASFRTESTITSVKQGKLKRGKNIGAVYARCTLTDPEGNSAEMMVWPEQWKKHKSTFSIGRPIRALCRVNTHNNINSLVLDKLEAAAGA